MSPERGDPPGGSSPSEPPDPPPLGAFLERSPSRLLLEAALGMLGAFLLASVLPWGAGREVHFMIGGAITAPLALMLTPVEGSVPYRALRYGAALAVIVTLVLSFALGLDGLLLEELLAFGILLFGVGSVGHGLAAATFDREPEES